MITNRLRPFLLVLLTAFMLASLTACPGGGGGDDDGCNESDAGESFGSCGTDADTDTDTDTTVVTGDGITLVASSSTMESDASLAADGVDITAVVTDTDNNLLENASVSFSVTSGAIQVPDPAVTDSNGEITAILTTGGDPTQRTITVTAETGSVSDTVDVRVVATVDSATVETVTLLSASPELPSASSSPDDGIELTAIVQDTNGSLMEGQVVTFSTPGAAAQVTQGTTDANGVATAILTTGGDPSNRQVTVTASSSGVDSNALNIAIVGTSLEINGPLVVGSGDTVNYQVTLTDSSGAGIASQLVDLASAVSNTLSAAQVQTDFNGQATFSYTGDNGGADQLTASGAGADASLDINVANSTLVFLKQCADGQDNDADASTDLGDANCVDSDDDNEGDNLITSDPIFDFNDPTILTVRFISGGVPTAGRTVNFVSTRGDFVPVTGVANDNGNGTYSITIESDGSDGAGGSVVTASEATDGASDTTEIVFRATTPTNIGVQASPAKIPTSGTSTVKAVVRDVDNNLVANQKVNFSLVDSTGGTLSAAQGVTNSQGVVTVTYQASSTPSANNGVEVTATPVGFPGVTGTAFITVGGQALFISLGTGNELAEPDATTYALPFTAVVTDSGGNPAPDNTVFNVEVISVSYQKGAHISCAPPWITTYTIPAPNLSTSYGQGCPNEDVNFNGILEAGEDANGNGKLEPGNVVSVPTNLVLDENGTADFDLTYTQDRANWIKVTLRAKASVSGTESIAETTFILPGIASDFNNCAAAPPGQISPYGTGSSCFTTEDAECSNGIDDDGDGFIDGDDASCSSVLDDDEALPAQCNDGVDNDLDGDTDFDGGLGDAQCADINDDDEAA